MPFVGEVVGERDRSVLTKFPPLTQHRLPEPGADIAERLGRGLPPERLPGSGVQRVGGAAGEAIDGSAERRSRISSSAVTLAGRAFLEESSCALGIQLPTGAHGRLPLRAPATTIVADADYR